MAETDQEFKAEEILDKNVLCADTKNLFEEFILHKEKKNNLLKSGNSLYNRKTSHALLSGSNNSSETSFFSRNSEIKSTNEQEKDYVSEEPYISPKNLLNKAFNKLILLLNRTIKFFIFLKNIFNVEDKKNYIIYYDLKNVPIMRGKIHLILLFISPIFIYNLLKLAKTNKAFISVNVLAISVFTNFLSSTLYHNFQWNPHITTFLKKIDHACIFLMISGSTCPVSTLLHSKIGGLLFPIIQWAVTFYGVLSSFKSGFSFHSPKMRSLFYIFVGGLNIFTFIDLCSKMLLKEILLTFLLAFLYLIGGIVFAIRWPNPIKSIFGYHELFHLCCFGSAVCTYYLNHSVLNRI